MTRLIYFLQDPYLLGYSIRILGHRLVFLSARTIHVWDRDRTRRRKELSMELP